jgi:septal ring-binding cell division protein DamX
MTKGGKRMIAVSLVVLVILAPCLFGLLFALNASSSSEGNSGEEAEEHSELIKTVMDASAEDEIPASEEANSEDDQDQEQSVIEETLEGDTTSCTVRAAYLA